MPLSLSLVILVLLQKHLSLNRISNVVVHALVVSDQSGTGAFCCGDNPSMGRLDTDGHSHVPVAALDDLVFVHKIPPPDLIKMDIEGGISCIDRNDNDHLEISSGPIDCYTFRWITS